MKLTAAILSIMLLLLTPISINAEHSLSSIDKLDQISDEALQLVKSSRYEDAKRLLDYFSDQFLTYTMDHQTFSMDELRIVTTAHNEAVEAMASPDLNHIQRMNTMTKFRLAIDAVTSSHQPLWTDMEEPIMTVFAGMKEAAIKGDSQEFHSHLNSFLVLYEVIYPSMKLDVAFEKVQEIDTRVSFIDQYRPSVLTEPTSQGELSLLEQDLKDLFDGVTEDEADPSLWWVIITTGSIILVTLSYVGWRKYKGEKEIERQKTRM